MKIELWAKKLDKGHVLIGEVNVPENIGYTYKIPIKPHLELSTTPSSCETAMSYPIGNYRTFVLQQSYLDKIFKHKRRYLEE